MFLKLAFRNIWRNKGRTSITIASIMFAVLFSSFMNAFQKGGWVRMLDNVVNFYYGYAQIHKNGYWEEKSINKAFELTDEFEVIKNGMDTLIKEISETDHTENCKLHINFEDDNILFYTDYFLEILNYIQGKCQKNKIDFSFTTENGMDYLLLTNELLDKFKDFNLIQLNLSMASMDNNQLRKEKRSGNLKKLESILEYSKILNIPSVTYFICGLEDDTPVKTVQTLKYLHSQNTSIGISLYYPVPGLSAWQSKKLFINQEPSLCRGSSAYPWNKSLSTQELITAFRLARTSNYIKASNYDKSQIDKLEGELFKDSTMGNKMVNIFFNFPVDTKTN